MADKNRADNCGNNIKPEWIPSAYSDIKKHQDVNIKANNFKPLLNKQENAFIKQGFKRKFR